MDSKKALGIVLIIIGLVIATWGLISFFSCHGISALMPPDAGHDPSYHLCGYENPVTIATFITGIALLLIGIYVYREYK